MSKKATHPTEKLTYTQAMEQLRELVARLQDPDCDIDLLRDYTKQAMELLKFCKSRLTETDAELQKLLAEIEEEQ